MHVVNRSLAAQDTPTLCGCAASFATVETATVGTNALVVTDRQQRGALFNEYEGTVEDDNWQGSLSQ